MDEKVCCVFGHRKINVTNELNKKLYNIFEDLIVKENINKFLFGSKSQFDDLCYQIISDLKAKYTHIERIYVRAEFPNIDDDYREYLLQSYEETYYPDNILNAGKLAYIERNCEMINRSKVCIIYFDEKYEPLSWKNTNMDLTEHQRNSGTKIAYTYALRKQKLVINVFDDIKKCK